MSKIIKQLYPFTKDYRILFWFSVLTSPLQWIVAVFTASIGFKNMVEALQNLDKTAFLKGILLYATGVVVSSIIRGLSVYSQELSITGIQLNMRKKLAENITRQRVSGKEQTHTGELLTINDQDTEIAAKVLCVHLLNIITPILVSIVCIIAIMLKSWFIACVEIATMLIVFVLHRKYQPLYRATGVAIQDSLAKFCSVLEDNIIGTFVIRVFSLQNFIKTNTESAAKKLYDKSMAESLLKVRHRAVVSFLFYSSVTLPFLLSAVLVIYRVISFSNIVYITQLTNNLLGFSNGLATAIAQYQRAVASVERVFSFLEIDLEPTTCPTDFSKPGNTSALLSLHNITVAYNDKTVLKGINLEIPQNKTIAIIGESGAGKSTLAKVLLSLTNFSGEIAWCGNILHGDEILMLRNMISYVPQGTPLFQDSIYQNILYGRESASEKEVLEAAEKAGVSSFQKELPMGFQTLVGERDMLLSGGQCQKIAIARALLKKAPVILLDEATSALDKESIQVIQNFLDEWKGRCTIITITHDLTSIQNADLVCVLKQGEIIESGSHLELLKTGTEYPHLLNQLQSVKK